MLVKESMKRNTKIIIGCVLLLLLLCCKITVSTHYAQVHTPLEKVSYKYMGYMQERPGMWGKYYNIYMVVEE